MDNQKDFSILFVFESFKNWFYYVFSNVRKIAILTTSFLVIILSYNYCISNSVKLSSNISYIILIVNFNVIITTIFGYYLFNQKINKTTLLGILISLIGLSIIICNVN